MSIFILPKELIIIIARYLTIDELKCIKKSIECDKRAQIINGYFDILEKKIEIRTNKIIEYQALKDKWHNTLRYRMHLIIGDSSNLIFMRSPSDRQIEHEGELGIRKRYAQRYLSLSDYSEIKHIFIVPEINDDQRLIGVYELNMYLESIILF